MHDSEVRLSGPPSDDALEQWRFYLSGLRNFLETRIAGQAGAAGKVARAIQAAELGFNDGGHGPKCSFLLLGPTGVGKTESAKCFTEYIFGSRIALEMIFMNEYSSDLRFPEFLERTEASIRRHPSGSTLLFDEIEKAHPKLIDVFLSLLDEGELTTLSGERISVTGFYIVLTSNLGSGDLARMENAPYATMERVALDIASQYLRPELFARVRERIVFKPLSLEVQKKIIQELVAKKIENLSRYFGKDLSTDAGPVSAFLLRVGYSKLQGARMLCHEVDRQLNSASLHWALSSRVPIEGKFYYDSQAGALVLK